MRGWLLTVGIVGLFLLMSACNGEDRETRRHLGVAEGCDAAVTTCFVRDRSLTISLKMGPGVTPLQPFPLTLAIAGQKNAVENVLVDFQMKGMDMGSNRYRLQPQQGVWQGRVTLPMCTASRMDWRAIIEFMLDGEPVQVVFPFHTEG